MSKMNKFLVATAAIGGLLAVSDNANATIVQPTLENYIASTTTPTPTTAFAAGNLVINNTNVVTVPVNTHFSAAFTSGNTFTFTLSQGTFAVLPTIAANGGTVAYVSGGAGQSQVTYQISGAVTDLTLSNVSVNGVTSVAGGSAIRVVVSDGAGSLGPAASTDKTYNLASFIEPYSVTFTPTPSGATSPLVDLGATSPGSRYTNSNNAVVGTVTITPATTTVGIVKDWAGTSLTTATAGIALTIPAGPFKSATLGQTGATCTLPATTTVTSSTANVVTFGNATGIPVPATPAPNACVFTLEIDGPTTGTALLGAGTTSAAVTVNHLSNSAAITNPTTAARTTSGSLASVGYANGSVFNAGYAVGADANYDFFVNVSNGSTSGPVIVTASTGGVSGTAVLTPTLAANTSQIYSIATIKAALEAAGMPASTFADATSRGQLQVVVPSGGRVTPLLQNKVNGQVVEISRQ